MSATPQVLEFLSAYFPLGQARLIASDSHVGRHVDVFLIEEEGLSLPHSVYSEVRQGEIKPLLVTELPHIPYSETQRGAAQMDDSLGVFIQVEDIFEPHATGARFRQLGREREAAVREGRSVLFSWNCSWLPLRHQGVLTELRIEDQWQATVSPLLAVTPGRFARTWLRFQESRDEADAWVEEALEANAAADQVPLVTALLKEVPRSHEAFTKLATAYVSQLMTESFLSDLKKDPKLRELYRPALQTLELI